jgi:hypothetical protein
MPRIASDLTPRQSPTELPKELVDPRLVSDPSYLRPAPIIRRSSELSEGDAIDEDEELVEILSSFGSTKSTARPIGHHIMRTAAASLSKSLKY